MKRNDSRNWYFALVVDLGGCGVDLHLWRWWLLCIVGHSFSVAHALLAMAGSIQITYWPPSEIHVQYTTHLLVSNSWIIIVAK